MPEWLTVGSQSGRVTDTPIFLSFDTTTEGLEYGEYNGEILIDSNGGSAAVDVYFVNKAPKLRLWLPISHLTRHQTATEMRIINIGGNLLEWRVASKPDWIELSSSGGTVKGQPDFITLTALLSKISYGDHDGVITIESNGGTGTINVDLLYEREVEVFPGRGAAQVELSDVYLKIVKIHGQPDKDSFEPLPKKEFQYVIEYTDKGLLFKFVKTSTLVSNASFRKTNYIHVSRPYDGLTDKNVGIGNTRTEIIAAYGEPDETDLDNRIDTYLSGISFYYDSDGMLTAMSIF